MKRYTIYIRTLIAAATLALAAGCNKFSEPDSPVKGMNIKPVFGTEIPSSATKAGDAAESRTLEPLILDDGTQIEMSVTKDTEWPIAGPGCDTVLTKGTVYSGAAAYEAKSFRLSAWNASQSSSVLFAAKEYTCDAQHNWSTSQPPVWPMSSDNLAFVGVWDYDESAVASIVSGKYAVSNWDVSGNYADQKDLRAAFATYPADNNGDALLHFNPYMNAIKVKVGTLPEGVKISAVYLVGVGVKGTLVFPDSYTPVAPVSGRDSYVGDWTDVTTGNLNLAGNWASGASVTPDGTAFLIIDPDGGSLQGKLQVLFTGERLIDMYPAVINLEDLLGTSVHCGEAYTITIGLSGTLSVEGSPRYNYKGQTVTGGSRFDVTASSPWRLQCSLDDGNNWFTPAANSLVDNWIKFSQVSGSGGSTKEIVWLTVSPASGNFESVPGSPNKLIESPPRGTESEPWDLSTHDIHGNPNPGNNMNTANCYVVSAPGWYSFPMVYGNAIKDGSTNSQAYYCPGAASTSGVSCLTRFVSGSGPINSPWISDAVGATMIWKIINYDMERPYIGTATVDKCYISGSNIVFHLTEQNLRQGNLLIGVYDSDGEIIWSWHIWVTDIDLTPVKNSSTSWLPVNLGWVVNENATNSLGYKEKKLLVRFVQEKGALVLNEVKKYLIREPLIFSVDGNSMYYQWGRKDPFDARYAYLNTYLIRESMSIQESCKRPDRYIATDESLADQWHSGSKVLNLWAAVPISGWASDAPKPIKTVYDPCPPGYQVPSSHELWGLSTVSARNDFGIFSATSTGETLFLPYSDEIVPSHYYNIRLPVYGEKGVFWTANHENATYGWGYAFRIDPREIKEINSLGWEPASGLPVRPVQE